MVTSQEGAWLPVTMPSSVAMLREGLESLTVTGPSRMLEAIYREARNAVIRRPSREDRELAISQAWASSSKAAQLAQEGNQPAAARLMDQMYSEMRAAISASRSEE